MKPNSSTFALPDRWLRRGAVAGMVFLTATMNAGAQTAPPGVAAPTTVTAPPPSPFSGTTPAAPPTSTTTSASPPTSGPSLSVPSSSSSSSSFPSISTSAQAPCALTVTSATTASLASSTQPTTTTTSSSSVSGAVNSYAAPLVNGNSAGGVSASLQQYQNAGVRPVPFGSELFCGGNVSASTVGVVDPGYIIKTGDSISVYLWGSVPDAALTAVVDTNGNITVPAVGPVHVAGLPAGTINQAVNSAAATVYRNAVHIYAAPVTTVPITVFITGPVMAPGPYAGLGSDSIIAYLQRAERHRPERRQLPQHQRAARRQGHRPHRPLPLPSDRRDDAGLFAKRRHHRRWAARPRGRGDGGCPHSLHVRIGRSHGHGPGDPLLRPPPTGGELRRRIGLSRRPTRQQP